MFNEFSCRSPPCGSRSASRQRGHSVGCRSSRHASLPAVTDVHMMWKKQLGLRNCCIDALPSATVLVPRTVSLTGCCHGISRCTASSMWLGGAQQAASESVGRATGKRGAALFRWVLICEAAAEQSVAGGNIWRWSLEWCEPNKRLFEGHPGVCLDCVCLVFVCPCCAVSASEMGMPWRPHFECVWIECSEP